MVIYVSDNNGKALRVHCRTLSLICLARGGRLGPGDEGQVSVGGKLIQRAITAHILLSPLSAAVGNLNYNGERGNSELWVSDTSRCWLVKNSSHQPVLVLQTHQKLPKIRSTGSTQLSMPILTETGFYG